MSLDSILILYSSQTGTAKSIAELFVADDLPNVVTNPRIYDLTAYTKIDPDFSLLGKEENPVIFIIATTGQGDFPDNALPFMRVIRRMDKKYNPPGGEVVEPEMLPFFKVKMLNLGLGDSNYDRFNGGIQQIERFLARLGCQKHLPTIHADDGIGLELGVEKWRKQTVEFLKNFKNSQEGGEKCEKVEGEEKKIEKDGKEIPEDLTQGKVEQIQAIITDSSSPIATTSSPTAITSDINTDTASVVDLTQKKDEKSSEIEEKIEKIEKTEKTEKTEKIEKIEENGKKIEEEKIEEKQSLSLLTTPPLYFLTPQISIAPSITTTKPEFLMKKHTSKIESLLVDQKQFQTLLKKKIEKKKNFSNDDQKNNDEKKEVDVIITPSILGSIPYDHILPISSILDTTEEVSHSKSALLPNISIVQHTNLKKKDEKKDEKSRNFDEKNNDHSVYIGQDLLLKQFIAGNNLHSFLLTEYAQESNEKTIQSQILDQLGEIEYGYSNINTLPIFAKINEIGLPSSVSKEFPLVKTTIDINMQISNETAIVLAKLPVNNEINPSTTIEKFQKFEKFEKNLKNNNNDNNDNNQNSSQSSLSLDITSLYRPGDSISVICPNKFSDVSNTFELTHLGQYSDLGLILTNIGTIPTNLTNIHSSSTGFSSNSSNSTGFSSLSSLTKLQPSETDQSLSLLSNTTTNLLVSSTDITDSTPSSPKQWENNQNNQKNNNEIEKNNDKIEKNNDKIEKNNENNSNTDGVLGQTNTHLDILPTNTPDKINIQTPLTHIHCQQPNQDLINDIFSQYLLQKNQKIEKNIEKKFENFTSSLSSSLASTAESKNSSSFSPLFPMLNLDGVIYDTKTSAISSILPNFEGVLAYGPDLGAPIKKALLRCFADTCTPFSTFLDQKSSVVDQKTGETSILDQKTVKTVKTAKNNDEIFNETTYSQYQTCVVELLYHLMSKAGIGKQTKTQIENQKINLIDLLKLFSSSPKFSPKFSQNCNPEKIFEKNNNFSKNEFFSVISPNIDNIFELCSSLKPRSYSISSSPYKSILLVDGDDNFDPSSQQRLNLDSLTDLDIFQSFITHHQEEKKTEEKKIISKKNKTFIAGTEFRFVSTLTTDILPQFTPIDKATYTGSSSLPSGIDGICNIEYINHMNNNNPITPLDLTINKNNPVTPLDLTITNDKSTKPTESNGSIIAEILNSGERSYQGLCTHFFLALYNDLNTLQNLIFDGKILTKVDLIRYLKSQTRHHTNPIFWGCIVHIQGGKDIDQMLKKIFENKQNNKQNNENEKKYLKNYQKNHTFIDIFTILSLYIPFFFHTSPSFHPPTLLPCANTSFIDQQNNKNDIQNDDDEKNKDKNDIIKKNNNKNQFILNNNMMLFGPGTGSSPFLSFIEHKHYTNVIKTGILIDLMLSSSSSSSATSVSPLSNPISNPASDAISTPPLLLSNSINGISWDLDGELDGRSKSIIDLYNNQSIEKHINKVNQNDEKIDKNDKNLKKIQIIQNTPSTLCLSGQLQDSCGVLGQSDQLQDSYGQITLFTGNRYRSEDFLHHRHWYQYLTTSYINPLDNKTSNVNPQENPLDNKTFSLFSPALKSIFSVFSRENSDLNDVAGKAQSSNDLDADVGKTENLAPPTPTTTPVSLTVTPSSTSTLQLPLQRYVQDIIPSQGDCIAKHILSGGFIYICGDGVLMSKQVQKSLEMVLITHGSKYIHLYDIQYDIIIPKQEKIDENCQNDENFDKNDENIENIINNNSNKILNQHYQGRFTEEMISPTLLTYILKNPIEFKTRFEVESWAKGIITVMIKSGRYNTDVW